MQQIAGKIGNKERADKTRAALLEAARKFFVEKGYADSGTPAVVRAAGVTRGALSHHFKDTRALFFAVVENESQAVSNEIEAAADAGDTPLESLKRGGAAFLSAMRIAGRTRLLLIDGPAVLGRRTMFEIDRKFARNSLRLGLLFAMETGQIRDVPLKPLTNILSAAFDGAALSVEGGMPADDVLTALSAFIDGLRCCEPG